MTLRVVHTADLEPSLREAARDLLREVFGEEMTDADWEHCLGGMHAVLPGPDGAVIAHAAVVQRRLLHGGRALRAGYVEGVAVHPEHRGRGHGAAVMSAVERVIAGAYDLGALGSTEEAAAFYAHRGWRAWQGPTSALTPRGVERTADEDGWIYVLPAAAPLDLAGELTCDWRDGDAW